MNDSEKNAVLFLRIAQDLKVSEATIGAETVETLYNLINRQQAEIDRLNIELKTMRGAANSYKAHYEDLKSENLETIKILKTAKSEAVREFAEKLKTEIAGLEVKSPNTTYKCGMEDVLYYRMPKIIDQLVEEMGCNDG